MHTTIRPFRMPRVVVGRRAQFELPGHAVKCRWRAGRHRSRVRGISNVRRERVHFAGAQGVACTVRNYANFAVHVKRSRGSLGPGRIINQPSPHVESIVQRINVRNSSVQSHRVVWLGSAHQHRNSQSGHAGRRLSIPCNLQVNLIVSVCLFVIRQ
jgi:hypothetical protein